MDEATPVGETTMFQMVEGATNFATLLVHNSISGNLKANKITNDHMK
jgi:hypothetical protein